MINIFGEGKKFLAYLVVERTILVSLSLKELIMIE
jgi:hypothetical protein